MPKEPVVRYQSDRLMKAVGRLLKATVQEAKACRLIENAPAFAAMIGMPEIRLKTLKGQSKSITGDELAAIFNGARLVAAQSLNAAFVNQANTDIADILALLRPEPPAPVVFDRAIVGALDLTPGENAKTGKALAGNYLIFRRDTIGEIIVSRLQIKAPQGQDVLTTFETSRLSQSGPRTASGFMYGHYPYTYAIGLIGDSKSVRLTMLRPCRLLADDSRDLIGLRLGASAIDNGAFAHPLYCHAVSELPDLRRTGAFQSVEDVAQALEGCCDHVENLVRILDTAVAMPQSAVEQERWRFGIGLHRDA